MQRESRLLFGPLAAVVMAVGTVGLGFMVPQYSLVRQTVSEIGEVSSPQRISFAIMLWCVAALLLVFAAGVREACVRASHSPLAAYLIAFMALDCAALGVFAFPHPLHNVFGISELVAYQAPLALALAWRRDARAKRLVEVSWIFFALVWIALALNMTTLHREGAVWMWMRPMYGLVQRFLFASWFGWCAVSGLVLWRMERRGAHGGVGSR